MRPNRYRFYLWSLLPLALLLISCGGSTVTSGGSFTASSGSAMSAAAPSSAKLNSSNQSQAGQKNWAATGGTPYLVKTLSVTMAVKDTRQAANALQTWISTADP